MIWILVLLVLSSEWIVMVVVVVVLLVYLYTKIWYRYRYCTAIVGIFSSSIPIYDKDIGIVGIGKRVNSYGCSCGLTALRHLSAKPPIITSRMKSMTVIMMMIMTTMMMMIIIRWEQSFSNGSPGCWGWRGLERRSPGRPSWCRSSSSSYSWPPHHHIKMIWWSYCIDMTITWWSYSYMIFVIFSPQTIFLAQFVSSYKVRKLWQNMFCNKTA